MKSRFDSVFKLCIVFPAARNHSPFPRTVLPTCLSFVHTTYSTVCLTQEESVVEDIFDQPKTSAEVLEKWGCSDADISQLFRRRPTLRNADLNQLQFKLNLLSGLGITAPELLKMINCRPRLLSVRIDHCFDERHEFFMKLFGSRELLVKAIVRNPSLLIYDFHNKVKPTIALYEGMGLSREELVPMLISRPTLIPRTTFNHEKMEYIRKTGLSNESRMYKYVVTLIGISRLETISEKVANFEKFGFSEDEIFGLLGRSPIVFTLSVDKVQRNMTFVLGQMKLPATVILEHPFLLYMNLEAALKPRVCLAGKIEDMDLDEQIKGPKLLTALRMTEKRFVKAFVNCHPKDVADELMEYYTKAKGVKRLAEASKKKLYEGFPY
ncbi:transcription termination factor MTERF9, chloroplastic-like [Rosa sericea]